MAERLLDIKNLHTYFFTNHGTVKAVNGVDYFIEPGETLGIVGESGSGKSVSAFSILQLLEDPGKIVDGQIMFEGKDLSKLSTAEMRKIRGNEISMIFQEPMSSLNPVLRIGKQISEPLILHQNLSKSEAWQRSIEILQEVRIPNPERIASCYPFQLSGGMRQRVMIAMSLACTPKLLIADEPTTALDVTIQAQIFNLINKLKKDHNTAVLFITHDLGAIAELCDNVIVMYTGEVVERASVERIFDRRASYSHPYREGLLESIPMLNQETERLEQIEGSVPHPLKLPKGCRFSTRCKFAQEKCKNEKPSLELVDDEHYIRCFFPKREDRRGN